MVFHPRRTARRSLPERLNEGDYDPPRGIHALHPHPQKLLPRHRPRIYRPPGTRPVRRQHLRCLRRLRRTAPRRHRMDRRRLTLPHTHPQHVKRTRRHMHLATIPGQSAENLAMLTARPHTPRVVSEAAARRIAADYPGLSISPPYPSATFSAGP